jgi:hypothetical protein
VTFIDLQKQVLKKPWRPIEFILDSGDRVTIQHIEDIAWSPDGSRVFLFPDGQDWATTPDKITAVRRLRK